MADPNGGALATPIIDAVSDYEKAKKKLLALRDQVKDVAHVGVINEVLALLYKGQVVGDE
jgi:hypothetical protein